MFRQRQAYHMTRARQSTKSTPVIEPCSMSAATFARPPGAERTASHLEQQHSKGGAAVARPGLTTVLQHLHCNRGGRKRQAATQDYRGGTTQPCHRHDSVCHHRQRGAHLAHTSARFSHCTTLQSPRGRLISHVSAMACTPRHGSKSRSASHLPFCWRSLLGGHLTVYTDAIKQFHAQSLPGCTT